MWCLFLEYLPKLLVEVAGSSQVVIHELGHVRGGYSVRSSFGIDVLNKRSIVTVEEQTLLVTL
jgi:hypothetical protein